MIVFSNSGKVKYVFYSIDILDWYDLQSNITSIKTYAYQVTTGTPQSEKKMFYQNTWKDQLTRIEYYVSGSLSHYQTFTYDASGNVIGLVDSRTSYANKSYQWDGRQLSYYSAYCNSISYKYNDQGIRTQKAQGTCSGNVTTDYTLDGDKVLVETRSDGITLYFTYDVDGTLLSMNYNGAEYFYITNMQGDIIELVDINGVSVVKYKYDAWGNIVGQTGGSLADINPYRYRGYRFDVETGLYYLQSRYYDPAIGRFISSDGLLGETGNLATHNMYAYCANNPVMHVDPSGESFLLIGGAILLGGLIGGLVGVFTATDDENLWGAFAGGFVNGAINTAGLAAAIATGGTSAFAIAALTGLAGGVFGSMTNQSISYGSIDFGLAFANGVISATTNVMSLYAFSTFFTPYGATWGARFVDALLPSIASIAIQSAVGFSVPNPNQFRQVNSISSSFQTNASFKIDFSWR